MSSEDLPEEENGYSLKESTKLVGQLYPILKAKDGEILDGFHRSEADDSWRSEVLENVDSEEKKLAARLVANFHRRKISREEKRLWINSMAELYEEQGLRVEGEREKAQGPNEIVNQIIEVTGLSWRTVHNYLEPRFKQNSHARNDPSQHDTRSKASEILYNALAGRSPSWAQKVLERYQEELLESPTFRARVFTMLPNARARRSGSSISVNECPPPSYVVRDSQGFLVYKKEQGDKAESKPVSIEMSNYYKVFIEECPQCICAQCPHAATCIERVRSEE